MFIIHYKQRAIFWMFQIKLRFISVKYFFRSKISLVYVGSRQLTKFWNSSYPTSGQLTVSSDSSDDFRVRIYMFCYSASPENSNISRDSAETQWLSPLLLLGYLQLHCHLLLSRSDFLRDSCKYTVPSCFGLGFMSLFWHFLSFRKCSPSISKLHLREKDTDTRFITVICCCLEEKNIETFCHRNRKECIHISLCLCVCLTASYCVQRAVQS